MSTKTSRAPDPTRLWVKKVALGVETWKREAGAIVAEISHAALSGTWALKVSKRTRDDSLRTLQQRRFDDLHKACAFAGREWFYD